MTPKKKYEPEYRIDSKDGFAVASIEDPSCQECGGTGYLRFTQTELGKRYERIKSCPCSLFRKHASAFNRAQIPAIHMSSTIDNFEPVSTTAGAARDRVRAFINTWPKQRGFGLTGHVGCGKTHLLAATLRSLTLDLGADAGYVDASLLYAQIRKGFSEGKSGGEIIAPLAAIDVLAIDELGKGRGSPFELETLDELISRRYNNSKTTLFATNYSLAGPEDRPKKSKESSPSGFTNSRELIEAGSGGGISLSGTLAERVGERVYSRLCAMCDFLPIRVAGDPIVDFRRSPRKS